MKPLSLGYCLNGQGRKRPRMIMLDNMEVAEVKKAVESIRKDVGREF